MASKEARKSKCYLSLTFVRKKVQKRPDKDSQGRRIWLSKIVYVCLQFLFCFLFLHQRAQSKIKTNLKIQNKNSPHVQARWILAPKAGLYHLELQVLSFLLFTFSDIVSPERQKCRNLWSFKWNFGFRYGWARLGWVSLGWVRLGLVRLVQVWLGQVGPG